MSGLLSLYILPPRRFDELDHQPGRVLCKEYVLGKNLLSRAFDFNPFGSQNLAGSAGILDKETEVVHPCSMRIQEQPLPLERRITKDLQPERVRAAGIFKAGLVVSFLPKIGM